jgi:TonB family protein
MLFSLGMLLASPSSPATAASSTQNGFLASHYPPNALRNGEDGRVGFSVDIDEQGRIEKCAITQSSGYETLDRETRDFIVQFAGFGPVRDTSGKAQRVTQSGIIDWKLPAGIARSAAARSGSTVIPPPLLCRRNPKIGSIIAHRTECMTEAEWAYQDRLVRQELDQHIGVKPCTTEGC